MKPAKMDLSDPDNGANPVTKASGLSVPAYFLYGEDWTAETFGFFHIEPLSARNVPNDWKIGPHFHPDFDQFSVLFEGACRFEHDGRVRQAPGPCVVFTPAAVVHWFRYQPGSRGFVMSVSADYAGSLALDGSGCDTAMSALALRRLIRDPPTGAADSLRRLCELMHHRFANQHPHRRAMLRHLFGAFVLELSALLPQQGEFTPPRSAFADLYRRFSDLVETEIGGQSPPGQTSRKVATVQAFSEILSTTPRNLNVVCRSVCGRTAGEVIQAALLGQATRLLLYSDRPIKQIAYDLGYSSPSHFVRFFKQARGQTPEAFRDNPVNSRSRTIPARSKPSEQPT